MVLASEFLAAPPAHLAPPASSFFRTSSFGSIASDFRQASRAFSGCFSAA